jgi:multisubunit Na+/H+ antiporter MnhG subunit
MLYVILIPLVIGAAAGLLGAITYQRFKDID